MPRYHLLAWRFLILAVPAVLLVLSPPASAEEPLAAHAVSITGIPRLMTGDGGVTAIEMTEPISAGHRIRTGPGDRALIRFAGRPDCRIILETNSILEILPPDSPDEFKARLLSGHLFSRESACGMTLDVSTPAARIREKDSEFRLFASEGTTTVDFKSGDMRLLNRGQAILLRPMTRTIISRIGTHRITSILERKTPRRRALSAASPTLGNPGASPMRGDPALSEGFSEGGISPISAPGRP